MNELRPISASLPMQLLRAREASMAQFRPMLRAHGLTDQQWRVIRVLASQGEQDAGQLAAQCLLLAPSLTRILQLLEEDGLLQRAADPTDQRRTLVALTRRGAAQYQRISPHSEGVYCEIERQFGKGKLKRLNRLLQELTEAISAAD